jgi:hypothetical protein
LCGKDRRIQLFMRQVEPGRVAKLGTVAPSPKYGFQKLISDVSEPEFQDSLLDLYADQGICQTIGQKLFTLVFAGDINALFKRCRNEISSGRGLRVKLRLLSAELFVLPWEFMYDPDDGYLALFSNISIVRYIERELRIKPLRVTPPLRILGVIANPKDQEQLDVVAERESIDTALVELKMKRAIEIEWLEAGTLSSLRRKLLYLKFWVPRRSLLYAKAGPLLLSMLPLLLLCSHTYHFFVV